MSRTQCLNRNGRLIPGTGTLFILVVLLSLWSAPTWAGRVDTLLAQVPVADRGQSERGRGFSRAMSQVLVKVSGQRDVLQLPASRSLISSAQRYARSWSYEEIETVGGDLELILQVQFDPEAVIGNLRRQGLPVWPSERPDLLLIILLEQDFQRQFLSEDHLLVQQAMASARQRGLPAVVPLYDLEDRRQLDESAVSAGFLGGVEMIMQRYGSGVALVGRFSRSGESFEGAWTLLDGLQERELSRSNGEDALVIVNTAVEEAADSLGRRFAEVPNRAGTTSLRVRISEVRSATDYARVFAYLDALSVVDRVEPVSATGDQIEFELVTLVSGDTLAQSIATGQTLRQESTWGASGAELRFTLRR